MVIGFAEENELKAHLVAFHGLSQIPAEYPKAQYGQRLWNNPGSNAGAAAGLNQTKSPAQSSVRRSLKGAP